MVRVGPLPTLILLGAASWAIPAWELAYQGRVSVISIVTALLFTVMLAVWPFLNGHRVHNGHAEKALMCRDCRSLRWPGELSMGFCIHCGSARPPIPLTT